MALKCVQSDEYPEEIWVSTNEGAIFTIFFFPISRQDCQQIEITGDGKEGHHILKIIVNFCEPTPLHTTPSIFKVVCTPLLVVIGHLLSLAFDSKKARLEAAVRRKQHFESLEND